MRHRFFLSSLLILALPGISQAGVMVDSASRSIGVSVNGSSGVVVPDPDPSTAGLYDKTLNIDLSQDDFGSASLLSNFGATTFSGRGTANTAVQDSSTGQSHSSVDLTITLDQMYSYQLAGQIMVDGDFGGSSTATASLGFGPTGGLTTNALNTFGLASINQSGSLGPGTYQLSALALSFGDTNGVAFINTSFDFTLSLQQSNNTVPEPGTLSMFALMFGAGLTRRRRRR